MNTAKRTGKTSKIAATGALAASMPPSEAKDKRTHRRKLRVDLLLEGGFASAYEQMLSLEGPESEQELLRYILKDEIRMRIEAAHPSVHRKYDLNHLIKVQPI